MLLIIFGNKFTEIICKVIKSLENISHDVRLNFFNDAIFSEISRELLDNSLKVLQKL